jgi:tetratricopeptide (TPR) repeat protein
MYSSPLNLPRAESPRTQATAIHNIIAPSSTFNNVAGHQYNITNVSSASNAPAPSQAAFNDAPIDNLSIHFTGRKKELALITKAFEQCRDVPLRCALHGNQGVGKSQLTYSWAKSTFASKENTYIMWISATTVEKIFQGFCRLLRFVDHPHQSHPDQNARLEAARRWLEEVNTGNWLLVFDNVFPETVDFLRQHLPRVNGRGTILFTTRTRNVAIAVTSTAGEQHEVIEVPLLSVKEGVELFCGHFDTGKVDPLPANVEAIVKALGCLPLAISHAAAYMDQSHSSLDDMLELYRGKHKIDVSDRYMNPAVSNTHFSGQVMSWEHTLSDYEHKSVTATFASQLQDLDQQYPGASKLLRVIAFFDPESIPLEMLITGAKAIIEEQEQPTRSPFTASLLALIQSPVATRNAITQLQARCLVAYHAMSPCLTLRIHDLIQLVVLENTRGSGLHEESFELAVDLVCAAFKKIEDPSSPEWWPQCELFVPHIQSLTARQDTSNNAKKALLLANNCRGLYLSSRGRFVEAESLFENVIADREQLYSPNDLDTLNAMHNLALVYVRRGRYVDAEMLFKPVLESLKTQLGPEHRDTLYTMYRLAEVYLHRNRYDDAETLLKQTLQSQESQFGSEDDHTLFTMNSLADVYNSQQRYDEAELLLKPVLLAREKLLGSEHHHTLNTKHALANVYLSQRHYDAAAALFQQVLRASEREAEWEVKTPAAVCWNESFIQGSSSLLCVFVASHLYARLWGK